MPENIDPQQNDLSEAPVTAGETVESTVVSAAESTPVDESTIGTGTSMALGCIAGTVLLIIFGLLFLFISTLV